MVSIFRRGLFWRVYLTLLGSLVLVALLAAMLWHQLADQPMAGAMSASGSVSGAAVGALLPGKDAPRAEMESALRRVSAAVGGRVTTTNSAGRPMVTAENGRIVLSPDRTGSGAGAHVTMMRGWRVHLTDGRTLLVERPARPGPGGPHILAMLIAIAAAVGLAAYPIVSRLTRRLETLRSSLDAWGAGRLDSRARVDGRDEIAAVAASFNAAADRVETLLAAHGALLAHASHELRSPLTRLRIAVEMFAGAPDAALRAAIDADIAELDTLVEEILLASRLDHTPVWPQRERVDCLALAAEEGARGAAAVRHEGAAQSSFEVEGSPRLLRRLIRNLIENAVRHGAPPVEIELGRSGNSVTIAVHDCGPGIPEAERERVFEPFYRPSGRTESAGSWGLGLSIVRQIALRHDGSVSCRPKPGGGVSFVAVLPAAPASTKGSDLP
jgi:two-component system OmpR family sensor kinase